MIEMSKAIVIAVCLALGTAPAMAQQRVHAASGTVTAIHPKIGMIELDMDDGSSGHFKRFEPSDGPIDFDKSVSGAATPAGNYTTVGIHAVVYYVGQGDIRSVVALRPLGADALKSSIGVVVKLNRRDHLLTIKNSAGAEETFPLDAHTVADTENGVAAAFKYNLNRGSSVRVLASKADGSGTAVLVAPVL